MAVTAVVFDVMMGVAPREIVYAGDRAYNDVEPALAASLAELPEALR